MMEQRMLLEVPAAEEYMLAVRMAMSGVGVAVGLDVDLLDDLTTATNEICDCLMHQPHPAKLLRVETGMKDKRLCCRFEAEFDEALDGAQPSDLEVTRCILETVLPDVALRGGDRGVREVAFSLPIA